MSCRLGSAGCNSQFSKSFHLSRRCHRVKWRDVSCCLGPAGCLPSCHRSKLVKRNKYTKKNIPGWPKQHVMSFGPFSPSGCRSHTGRVRHVTVDRPSKYTDVSKKKWVDNFKKTRTRLAQMMCRVVWAHLVVVCPVFPSQGPSCHCR